MHIPDLISINAKQNAFKALLFAELMSYIVKKEERGLKLFGYIIYR